MKNQTLDKKSFLKVCILLLLTATIFSPFSTIVSKATAEDDILEIIDSELKFLESHVEYSETLYALNIGQEPEPSVYVGDYVCEDGSSYSIEYHKGTKYVKYEEYKEALLMNATPYATMLFLGFYPKHINVNGDLYVFESLGSWFEGGMRFNKVEIIEESEQYMKVLASYTYENEVFHEEIIELKKHGGNWKIDYVEGIVGSPTAERNENSMTEAFSKYVHNFIKGYVVSENINSGYEKFSEKLTDQFDPDFESIKVQVTSFNKDSLSGSAYAIVDEYDKSGNVVAQHKITVDIGGNLSENITDVTISRNNPPTADVSAVLLITAIASVSPCLFAIKKKQ